MKRIHYAWIICAACTLLLFCTAGLTTTAFSVHQPYLLSTGGLTNTQSSLVITIRNLFGLLAMLVVNRLHKKTGIRLGATISVLVAACAFFTFSLAKGAFAFYVSAAAMGLAYGLGGMIPVSIMIGRWFRGNRSLALGICAAGTGAASIVVPPAVTFLIEAFSLETAFRVEMLACLAVAAIVYIVLKNEPAEKGLLPLGAEAAGASAPVSVGKPMSRSAWISMCAAIALIGAVANPAFSHLSVLFSSEGYSSAAVSFLLSFLGVALTLGKCIFGRSADKLGPYRSGFIFFSCLIAGEALCCLSGSGSMVIVSISMLLLGLGLPLSTVGLSVFAAHLSTGESYASTIKTFQVTYMVGALTFGPLPGIIADNFGSYVPFYVLMVAFALISAVMVQLNLRAGEKCKPCPQMAAKMHNS